MYLLKAADSCDREFSLVTLHSQLHDISSRELFINRFMPPISFLTIHSLNLQTVLKMHKCNYMSIASDKILADKIWFHWRKWIQVW